MPVKMCDRCHEHPATISFTKNINGRVTSMDVCRQCADEMGLMRDFTSPLETLFPVLSGAGRLSNMVFGHYFESPDLIDGFDLLGDFLMNSAGAAKELDVPVFDVPGTGASSLTEKETLELELKKAVDQEDFETAAQLRDKLNALKKEQGGDKE